MKVTMQEKLTRYKTIDVAADLAKQVRQESDPEELPELIALLFEEIQEAGWDSEEVSECTTKVGGPDRF